MFLCGTGRPEWIFAKGSHRRRWQNEASCLSSNCQARKPQHLVYLMQIGC